MSPLAERITLIADQVALAQQWLVHGNRENAAEVLASVYDQLVDLAEEVDR